MPTTEEQREGSLSPRDDGSDEHSIMAVTCKALCRNNLSNFAEPCAEACIIGAGVAFDCEHATVVWGGDAKHILDALSVPALQAEVERLREMLSIALNMLELIASKMPVGAEVRNKIEAECAAMRSASRSLLKRATTARGE